MSNIDSAEPGQATDGIPGFAVPARGQNRRAAIDITPDLLALMLHLPEGVSITHAEYDHDRQMIRLTVHGDRMPDTEPEFDAWRAGTSDATLFQLDHGGHLWARAEWRFPWAEAEHADLEAQSARSKDASEES